MTFYRTLEERSNSGRFLAAYDPAVYASVLGQIEGRKKFYEENRKGTGQHSKRIERLEALANALSRHLQRAPNGTIRFPLTRLQAELKGKNVEKNIAIVFSKITIEEKSAKGIATYNFFIAYRKESDVKYGYLIHRVKN